MRKSWLTVILAVSVTSLMLISVAAAADQQDRQLLPTTARCLRAGESASGANGAI